MKKKLIYGDTVESLSYPMKSSVSRKKNYHSSSTKRPNTRNLELFRFCNSKKMLFPCEGNLVHYLVI